MHVVIVGSGNVGRHLAVGLVAAGHEVTLVVRDRSSADAQRALLLEDVALIEMAAAGAALERADAVVLATSTVGAPEAIATLGSSLRDLPVADATNALAFGPQGPRVPESGPSVHAVAEALATHAPKARLVKCFNTIGAEHFSARARGTNAEDAAPDAFLGGDDADAKQVFATLSEDLGFRIVDIGGIDAAPAMEHLATIWISMALRNGFGRDIAMRLADHHGGPYDAY